MIVNGIDTKDISVVVQGAVDKINTPKCLESIRKFLPCAEIVLSTWEGTDVTGLDVSTISRVANSKYIQTDLYRIVKGPSKIDDHRNEGIFESLPT